MKTNLTMAEEKEADMALASLADSARRFVELLERIEKYMLAQERERDEARNNLKSVRHWMPTR